MSADKDVTFSAREMEVLALAWQCMDTQPKIDFERLAKLTGYTKNSASVTFGKIKRKIKLLGDSLSTGALTTPKKTGGPANSKTPTTPRSTGTKRGGGAIANDTPSKRFKKSTLNTGVESDDEESLAGIRFKKEESLDAEGEDYDLMNEVLAAEGLDSGYAQQPAKGAN